MTEWNRDSRILIVGLGLLGGSYAKALKKRGFSHIYAIEKNPSSVDFALANGIVDFASAQVVPEWVETADLIVFALYPHVFRAWVEEHRSLFRRGTLLTDVTGVKSGVIEPIQAILPDGVEFVAAHPMAGREVYGVENSDERIFEGANFIVVPTERNSESAIERCEKLGELLGFARISRLSPAEHDEMIAFLSQLTHCIAVALMCTNGNPRLVDYTGDSFRDLTRIARINDVMWSELFLLNRDALLNEMNAFLSRFEALRDALNEGDVESMRAMMRLSTARRAAFDRPAKTVESKRT